MNSIGHSDGDDPSVPAVRDRREWLGLVGIALVAAGLRLWRLDQNAHGNTYYAAAVRSMLASFGNFFFGSFDPVGLVTVDKPPVAIWLQGLSALIFGYSGLSLLVPQALMGVTSILVLAHLVRRVWGTAAGLLAGLMLALTPICVAIDRDNLPDTSLVLVLLLAAWALSIAAETGRLRPLLVSAALVGLGFNIKMLAAFVVLPTFYLCYLAAARSRFSLKLAHLAAATLVLAAVSLSWSLVVEVVPKDRRPYIGGSRNDSALELALGYNGIGRVLGGRGNMGPPGGGPPRKGLGAADNGGPPKGPVESAGASGGPPSAGMPPFGPGGRFGGGMPPMFGGTPGFLRFTTVLIAGQITWLFPIAILGAIAAARRAEWRWQLDARHLSLALWGGWLATHWVVFSFAQGIFHEYYTTVMGPAVAALAAAGTMALCDQWKHGKGRGYLPTALVLSAAWAAYLIGQFPELRRWALPALGASTVISVLLLISRPRLATWRPSVPWVEMATALGVLAMLIGPACWSVGTVFAPGNSMMPAATPSGLTGGRDVAVGAIPMPPFGAEGQDNDKLIRFLDANSHGERIWVAGPASMEIAPLIIKTGRNAVSLGGFMGADPVLSPEEFARMVDRGEVRFVLIGGGPGAGMPFPPGGPGGPPGGPGGFGGGPGGPGRSEVAAWVREHGEVVEPALWKLAPEPEEGPGDVESNEGPLFGPGGPNPAAMAGFFLRMRGMAQLYDCKPELGRVPPADAGG